MYILPEQTTESVWKEDVAGNPAKPVFPSGTPPQPTGLTKLFELRL